MAVNSGTSASRAVLEGAGKLVRALTESAAALTERGRRIDNYQVLTRRLAGLATRYRAAEFLTGYAQRCQDLNDVANAFETTVGLEALEAVDTWAREFRLIGDAKTSELENLRSIVRDAHQTTHLIAIGQRVLQDGAEYHGWIWTHDGDGTDEQELRATTRRFARDVVAPLAEDIHRNDRLVPDEIISQMAEMGYFGMSVPHEYGGVGMSSLAMVIATEELSVASLPAAGSLITRPEILSRALLQGGTEVQKQKWLEPIATGKLMVAVAVTEPNVGSDVASITCRAERCERNGVAGYCINGAKAWCTFAGRAEVLALLARTDPDPTAGHKGLSLFIVEKDSFPGHDFEMVQPTGGVMRGKADATLGYRGMHSFTLQFEDYFVPAENLIGGESGVGKGFYLQMDGFAMGRLQTGGRAVGLAQASLESAVKYAKERPQFGKPIAEFENTQYQIGRMVVQIESARQLTHAAARSRDAGEGDATLLAAMAKLHACRVAVDVSQAAQLLHGGWGYAEEYAVSRYVVDALVLPIFEGVEPILEMKVIGRTLLSG